MIRLEKSPVMDGVMRQLLESLMEVSSYLSDVAAFNGEILSPAREKELTAILKRYSLPSSLKQDISIIQDNPYFRDIHLETVATPTVRYETAVIKRRTVLNVDFHRPVGKYLFHEHPLGYFDEDLELPVLKEGDKVWMSPVVSEIQSMGDGITKGRGRCLTLGLGLGVLPYLWLLKDEVASVTIVERNPDVIAVFEKYIRPQFNTLKPITVISGDAFDYYNEAWLAGFDYVYVDFWESTGDGLTAYMKLMETKLRPSHVDFWVETSILQDVKHLLASYLMTLYRGGSIYEFIAGQEAEMKVIAKKMNRYFKQREDVIATEAELLSLIHDREILRDILALTK